MFDPIAYINTPRWQASRLGLERMHELLERLGRPQDDLSFVHVAGTNGKGSTCAILESILREAGLRTGLFTSPFLYDFSERIRVRGEPIPFGELSKITLLVKEAADQMEDHPTEFELMCAVALSYFKSRNCDIVVLEVGLGGRLDATNVIEHPELCIITPISFDHEGILGSTLSQIAAEKAGIIKQGSPVLSAPQHHEVRSVLEERAQNQGASFEVLKLDGLEILEDASKDKPRWHFRFAEEDFEMSLLAPYQLNNACFALRAAQKLEERGWSIGTRAMQSGLARARWAGRFELISQNPVVIFDGGHNAQGAHELAHSIARIFPDKKACFVLGVMQDKDVRSMIEELMPCASRWICCEPDNPRALNAERLQQAIQSAQEEYLGYPACAQVRIAPSYEQALSWGIGELGDSEILVVCGSLYALAEARSALESLALERS